MPDTAVTQDIEPYRKISVQQGCFGLLGECDENRFNLCEHRYRDRPPARPLWARGPEGVSLGTAVEDMLY